MTELCLNSFCAGFLQRDRSKKGPLAAELTAEDQGGAAGQLTAAEARTRLQAALQPVLLRDCPGYVLGQLLQQLSLRADQRYKALVDALPIAETEPVMQARPLPSVALHLRTLPGGLSGKTRVWGHADN